MVFYKMQQGQNEFYFQLANLESAKEEYVFWKDGQVPPIPIKEPINGLSPRDAYWMPKDKMFDARHPIQGYTADRSFIRDIVVTQGGINTQYAFAFKKRDTDQLNAEIINITNLQHKNPLAFRFKYRKTGQGKETIRVVVAMDEVGLPQNVQQSTMRDPTGESITSEFYPKPIETPITLEQANKQYNVVEPQKVPTIAPNAVAQPSQGGFEMPPKPIEETPSPEEMTIITSANNHTDKFNEVDFIEAFKYSLNKQFGRAVTDERARKWFYQYYQKK